MVQNNTVENGKPQGFKVADRDDKPAEKMSLREKLENMKAQIKGASRTDAAKDNKFGIYQLMDKPELNRLLFESTETLKKLGKYADVVKPENYSLIYVGELSELKGKTQSGTLEAIYEKFNIDRPEDFRGHSLSVSDIVVLNENGENTAHYVDSFGFTEIPDFMKELEGEKELAFAIADCFISIQEVDDGYDYSIMDSAYKEIDGGVYDNSDISIWEALDEVLEDIKAAPNLYNVSENDKLTQIDYDELMEKVESAYRIELPSSVVSDFKEKTNELFKEINDMNPADIEETVKCYVQAKLDETGIDAVIVDAAVVGSRSRGLEQDGSDLDVVVELSTNEREDVLFDTFNEDGLCIGGLKVDINPITAARTGTLETYLPQVEDYLTGFKEAREQAAKGQVEDEADCTKEKTSLKARLAEKKAEAAGRDHYMQEKDNKRSMQRDISD